MRLRSLHGTVLRVLSLAFVLATPDVGWARRNGMVASSCNGCHGASTEVAVAIDFEPAQPEPGERVTLTLAISGEAMTSAGFFLEALGVDEQSPQQFEAIAGQATTLHSAGVTHSSPIAAQGGTARVQVAWLAPAEPGGALFRVNVVGANGDGRSTGDASGGGEFSLVWGCSAVTLYYDSDGDGFGAASYGEMLGCTANGRWSLDDGDCDENDVDTHPGATEVCNGRDDDCDGELDEDTQLRSAFRDDDGDGYGVESDEQLVCEIPEGYAEFPGDCNDRDAEVHPDAIEICNLVDDDCDGDVDERVRPRCGVGWCERLAFACTAGSCTPGEPSPERCNGLDDDCNGLVDDGPLCASGEACFENRCQVAAGIEQGASLDAGPLDPVAPAEPQDPAGDPATEPPMTAVTVTGGHTPSGSPPTLEQHDDATPEATSTSASPSGEPPGAVSCGLGPTGPRSRAAWLQLLLVASAFTTARVRRRYRACSGAAVPSSRPACESPSARCVAARSPRHRAG